MVRLQVLYRARLGFRVRLSGSACTTDQDYKVRVCASVCVCVCLHTHEHAAGTLVTEINQCLQRTLKMVALSAGHKFRYISVMVNSVFTTFSLIHTALPQGVR
jgi:hypothetical protein